MKLIVVKIIVLVLILICVDSKLSYELTEANMAKYWDNIQKQLNLLQQFNCTGKGLTEDSLAKILSLEFPHLNRLSFYIDFPKDTNVFLTPKLIKLVFTSNYFPHLKILNLKNTNIDNRYFQFLDESHQLISNLTYLNLQDNLISRKGFESLAKIDFQGKLTYLLIDNNLLIQSKAVSSVKSIICMYQNNICQTSLKYLSISSTEIQRESFINLMTTINSTQLQVLFMDSLTLIYYNQYNNGTNYTAFEALSKLNLPNLKRISLVGSLIDDNIAKIFENWTLPQLTHLDISQNQISDKGIKIWINKKNMPSLNFLLMRGTLMGDQSLLHFSTQKYQFKTLSIGDCQLSRKGHSNLSLLDTSQLQSLYFYDININSKQIQKFLQTNATKLTSLHFINSNDLKDIFTLMPWDNLPALKQLQFRNCDLFKSYTSMLLLLKTQKLLQNIKILKLFQTQIKNYNLFIKVLITISKVMPNLQQLIIYEFNKNFQSFLIIELLDELQFKNKILIETGLITLYKIPNKKYEIIKLLQPVILFLTKNFQKENKLSLDDIQKNIPEMSQKYQFGKLRQLKLNSRKQSDILFKIFEKLNITLLQSLTTLELQFPMEIDDFLDALSQFTFPKLQILSLNIIIPDNDDIQPSIKKLTNFLKRIKTLYQMSFDFEMLNELNTNDKRKKILQSFYFPFLISMKTQDQQIQLNQMSQFIKNHNQTLRKLIISSSFSQQGLFSLLSSSNIVLRNLDISSIQFPIKQFSIFGLVNTQFIDTFVADSAGLTDQHIIQMIDKKMQDKTGVFMPNLQRIDFQKNSIQQDGLKKWFSTGIHNLKILLIQQNNNPKYINQLLRYPNKISILIAVNIEIYEIDNNIHKDAAKYIKQVQLQTESLVGTDFQNLARMDFIKLDRIILLLNQIYDCQVLKSILKIVKEASALQLIFKNEKRGLNSSCLKDFQFQSKIQTIVIIDQYRTILIPEFINLLFNSDNQIKIIVFKELNLPKQTIQKIFSSQLQELNIIRFDGIEIGDNMIDLLMKNKFAVLQQLMIMNAYLTSKSLQKLINKPQPYQELQVMILNGNDFSQEIDISFKSLQSSQLLLLSLDQCDLPPSFLKALNSAQLAQLQALSLNYNSFSGDDIFQFISDIQRKSLISLTDILLNGHELNKTQYQNIMQVTESKRIRLELDEPRYLPKKNHASYA